MGRASNRERVLEAAERVLLERGIAALTLDAVAAAAGMSKGGLIYHFPGKNALVAGMVERVVERFEARMAAYRAAHPGPGSWTRAYLAASLPPAGTADGQEADREAALLAALGHAPELVAPYAARQEAWARAQQEDGTDPVTAAVVRLAADGLWMNEAFGITPLAPEAREEAVRRLYEMTRSTPGRTPAREPTEE